MGNERCLAVALVIACATWQTAIGQANLLVNPSFDDDLTGNWRTNGFTMERDTADVLDGTYSIKCSGRDRDLEGPIQRDLPIVKGSHYGFEGYAKLLDETPGKLWQNFKVIVQMDFVDGSPKESYIIAYRGFVTMAKGWMHIKGSIETPQKDFLNQQLAIRGPDAGLSFLVDNVTLYELPENPNWLGEAHSNVETFRKSNVNFNVALPQGVRASDVDLDISLKKHHFVFGAKIEEYDLVETPRNQYTSIVYNLFNWATVQAYKWKFNKGTLETPDFSRATDATDALLANGMKVRGHSILWDVEKNVPDEVKALPNVDLPPTLANHINYMMTLTNGKLQQFDVQNEHIHGHYYEETLQDPDVTKNSFVMTKAADPAGPVLYLNDFTCVTSGANTEDMYSLAVEYLAEGVPIEGLGCQGHTKNYVKPDPTNMWRRLDRLAETGLEVMMTEFDIGWHDVEERADWLEDAVRAFFGHPTLRGLIMWGFWNESMSEPDHDLITGPDNNNLKFLETGERFACLIKKEWTTKVTKNIGVEGTTFPLRVFQGDYEVIVKNQGVPVQKETFTLGKTDATVNIAVTSSTTHITVTAEEDLVPECISHRSESTVGSASTSSSDASLTCRIVRSDESGFGENDGASVSCNNDEVMTHCSSYHMGKSWTRNGEKMELNTGTGKMQCTAYNGRGSMDGVKAFARCCKVAGLTCDYKTAGPSLIFDGAMAEARCDTGQLALACSSYQPFPDSDGVRPKDDLSSCIAQSGAPIMSQPNERAGVTAFSACCSATSSLDCQIVVSEESQVRAGKNAAVTCPAGYEMTGCNGFAEDGKSAGTKISVPKNSGLTTCKAFMGETLPTGSSGVKAYATCCRV